MFRRCIPWVAILSLLTPAVVRGQGLLIVTDPAQHVRLPRPNMIYPPHPIPFPPPGPPRSMPWR